MVEGDEVDEVFEGDEVEVEEEFGGRVVECVSEDDVCLLYTSRCV